MDKIPIWLKYVSQNIPITKPKTTIIELALLIDKEEGINPYYERFKTYQYDVVLDGNKFELKLSKYGLVLLKNASLDQAIEIVRRRVDEIGTNEPNILKRGNDRILVELPGLDDPMRIKIF